MNVSIGTILFTMILLYLTIALVIQGSFTQDNLDSEELIEDEYIFNNNTDIDDEMVKDSHEDKSDCMDLLHLPDATFFPTSSVAMMTQVTDSDKSIEKQLEDIKEIAKKITLAIQSEMANLLSYALLNYENENEENIEDNKLRRKRSIETPMASTQLITRLLKHIKSNNEFQNIAIDKMMTAQEIADKYGIDFSPDVEIISDLAFAANQQAKEMNSLLEDTITMRNFTKDIESVRDSTLTSELSVKDDYKSNYPSSNYYYNYPYESQIPAPPSNQYDLPVSVRPNFYDTFSYSPDYYPPYCSMDLDSSSILFSLDEPEPELVGEEYEETISSKVYVDRGDEYGSATVNHVMTYTVAEKSHYKKPEIEKLPQHMQYSFYLM